MDTGDMAKGWRAAQDFFHDRIPLTRAMGVRVVANDVDDFVVEAPVACNSNHLGTAFGGSINAVATLAGYGLLWMETQDQPVEIVIAESSIRFLHPVRAVIHARCARRSVKEVETFREQLRNEGKARVSLSVRVEEAGRRVAEMKGTFVASIRQQNPLTAEQNHVPDISA